ncbi:ATP-grasp domain-containing protein [Actinosynnema sp. CS-041913]|uniref:ATP-grasp domain-containing protein n=1 Tax=Actinosynnema sp. CS-041913 TaxID=3239917 RepID=UPI003D8DF790
MLRVGTFLPAHPAEGEVGNGGVIPPDDHATLMDLLSRMPGVEFAHDLDFRDSHIRQGRVHCGDVCLNDLDVYLWHVDFARKPGSYDLDALLTLKHDTAVVPDPERIAVAFDKHWSYLTLARAGVPVPDSMPVSRRTLDAAAPAIEEWRHAVLKPRRGCFGWGVLFIDSFTTLRDIVGYIDSETTEGRVRGVPSAASARSYLLERFYPNDPDEWLGVTLAGQEVMYGFRKGADRHVRWNDFAWKVYDPERGGGSVEHREVPAAHAAPAHRAERAFGLPLLGLDIICHDGEPIVVDVNSGPALYPDLFASAGRSLPHELHRVFAAAIDAAAGVGVRPRASSRPA